MTPENLLQKGETKVHAVDHQTDQRPPLFPVFVRTMIIGIITLIALIHVGFFNTYIKFFPTFEDVNVEGLGPNHFNLVQHLHGMIMMGWVFMLLLQPILIKSKKMKLHRQVGQLSYVLAPLVLLFIFLINRNAYNHNIFEVGEVKAVGLLALTFPALIFFAVLYFLAIRYRHSPPLHMRFMCSTAFLFIPPAMDRALIVYLNLPGYDVGSIIELSIIGAVTIIDSVKTKRLSAFTLVFAFEILHKILWHARDSDIWQSIGSAIAKLF